MEKKKIRRSSFFLSFSPEKISVVSFKSGHSKGKKQSLQPHVALTFICTCQTLCVYNDNNGNRSVSFSESARFQGFQNNYCNMDNG